MRVRVVAAFFVALFSLTAESLLAAPLPVDLPPKVDERLLILDVRTLDEFAAGHLSGAILMPYDEIERKFSDADKQRPIVVYCRSGRRSAIAKTTLVGMGYTNVTDFGAIANWSGTLVRGR
jgi:rhodanese-related sulfurtransferase